MPLTADELAPGPKGRRKRRQYEKALVSSLGLPLIGALFLQAG